ncbi:MAG: penicillin-binding protein 2, partial [Gammaproteobacteria bacterium]|nr:penicillin-binding protein 2 [Gammaproteobacteria bacterium]
MERQLVFRDVSRESRVFKRRIVMAGAVMAILVLLIIARLIDLQLIKHVHFITLSHENRVKVLPIPPIRGLIYSRDGILLADNRPAFSLEIIPEQIDGMDGTIAELTKIININVVDTQRFYKLLQKQRRFDAVPLRFRLSDEEVARFSVNRHRFPGVEIAARLTRYYPLGPLTAHAVGYVGRIDENDLERVDVSNYSGTMHIGKLGVEKAYEDVLHGRVGYQQVEVNVRGRILRVLDRTPALPGKDLFISLDASLQTTATEALAGRRGAIVAIEPETGGVLALISSPAYDPNAFVNGIEPESFDTLRRSPGRPLFNRALQGNYPPGSTIKPFLALAALEYGVRDPDEQTWCPGWFKLKGSSLIYRDWKRGGHGNTNLPRAIIESCDVYFYSLANDLGIDRITAFLNRFGLGKKTGIDIMGEADGLIPSQDWKLKNWHLPWYPGETVINGIGQGFTLVTPVQLASATATLSARGRHMQPRLVMRIEDPITFSPAELPDATRSWVEIIEKNHWDPIISAMVDVVHGPTGTARTSGRDAPYRFAGKTGTSQLVSIDHDEENDGHELPEDLRDHSLF